MITLVEVLPADPRTGATAPVRLAGGGQSAFVQMGHLDWLAGVAGAPRFTAEYGFADGGWTGGAIPQTTPIVFQPADPATLAGLATRYWRDAPVRVWTQAEGGDPVLVLTGTVAADAWTSGGVTLTVSDLAGALAKPFSTGRFEGKGGIDGDPDVAGREKRRSFGRVFNVEARLLLKAFNVYEVGDPSRPLQGIVVARDRGRAGPLATVAWAGSIAATLAALIAAEVPKGGAVVAPSIACIRCGVQPAAPLTVDLLGEIGTGYVETVPAIAQRIIAEAAPALALRDPAEALAMRPAPAGLHVSSTTETAAQLLDRMLLGVSLLWSVEADGGVRLRSWTFGAALPLAWSAGAVARPWTGGGAAIGWAAAVAPERLRSHGAQRLKTYRPTRSRRVGYRRNHRPHDAGEIAADILASDVTYADGTPIDALKPAALGADVTADNTSKDTAAVGGVPAQTLIDRVVSMEDLLAPTGDVFTAFDDIEKSIGDITTQTDTFGKQFSGDIDSYLKRQIKAGADSHGALAELVSELGADFDDFSSEVDKSFGTAASATEAVAKDVTSLNTKLYDPQNGDVVKAQAILREQAGALTTLAGRTVAFWQVEADAGDLGVDAFVTVRAEAEPGQPPTGVVAIGAHLFMVVNPINGQPVKAFAVENGNTRVYGDLAVDGAVSMRNIKAGAVAPVSYAKTSAITSCPRGVQTSVISYIFTKLDADSALEVQMYAHCYNQDDLDFIATLMLDGQVLQSPPIRMPFDNAGSRGATTVTPMAILEGIPAGDHVITFAMTSNETEGPTMVSAGAFLRVTELRAPSIATVIGNSGNGSQIGGGGGGSGDPGDGGGGGSGGGGTGGGEVPSAS